jgi:MFS family permease
MFLLATWRNLTSWRPKIFYGWVILAVVLVAQFISGPGQTHSISVFIEPMKDGLGLSSGMIAGLYTAGSLTAALTVIFIGRLLDRFGARIMLSIVAVVFGFAVIGMSQVQNEIQLFLAFAFLRTVGQGAMILIPTTLLALWFVRKRGRVMAIAALGMVASQAAFPPLNKFLIDRYGWDTAWLILGVAILVVLVLPALILVRRSPESMGILPDGDSARPTQTKNRPISDEPSWTLGEALRTKTLWLLVLANISLPISFNALIFHNESLILDRGLDASIAAPVLSTIAPLVLVGNFIAGFMVEKIPGRFLLATSQAIIGLTMLWVIFMSQSWQAFVYGGLIGLAVGMSMTTNNVIWADYFGRTRLGSIRGVATTTMVTASAFGPLPFALIFDATNSHSTALVAFMVLPILSVAAAVMAVPPSRNQVVREIGPATRG